MTATLTRVRFYETQGYEPGEEFAVPLENGGHLPVERMHKLLEPYW